jgi:hypothetical protein
LFRGGGWWFPRCGGIDDVPAVNRAWGHPASQLHERNDAGDFDTKTQDKVQVVE